jgi:hypothetical protein
LYAARPAATRSASAAARSWVTWTTLSPCKAVSGSFEKAYVLAKSRGPAAEEIPAVMEMTR